MSARQPYSYVVLRYVHDVFTGEFVNVGLVMLTPQDGRLRAKTRKTISRIKGAFPDLDRSAFLSAMKNIDRGIRRTNQQIASEGLLRQKREVIDYARQILPVDDSALQWSSTAGGISSNAEETFDHLYARFVSRYDSNQPRRRSDDDIWRPVREQLDSRGIDIALEHKVVSGRTDSIEFDRAWKNGRWHVYEPLSFDLADADGIKDKARRWRGHLEAVRDGSEDDIELHFLIGAPSNPKLRSAYKQAAAILKDAPFNPAIHEETDIEEFVDGIEDEFRAHEATNG